MPIVAYAGYTRAYVFDRLRLFSTLVNFGCCNFMEMQDNTGASSELTGWILDRFVAPGAHLSQGDLIIFEDHDPLKKAGIVVTADCDLENNKHARLVTLVPIVSVDTILRHYLLIEDCELKRQKIEDFAYKFFKINLEQEEYTKKAILELAASQANFDPDDPVKMALRFTLNKFDFVSIPAYKSLMLKIGMNPKGAKSLSDQIRSRGDLLILPDISSLRVDGNIAWVRPLWQHPLHEIAIRTSEVGKASGERVARLDSPYRYRLTQKMAQVFSDIGLPANPDQVQENLAKVYENG